MAKNSNKIRTLILLNPPYYTGEFKNQFTKDIINRCRQDKYAVFKVLYSNGPYDHKTLCKLIKVISKQRKKITVISNALHNNILFNYILHTLTIMGHIDLCIYKQHINLHKIEKDDIAKAI